MLNDDDASMKGVLATRVFLHFLTNFGGFIMTFLVGDLDQLIATDLLGHLGAALGGSDHLHLVTVRGGQLTLTLRLAVHICVSFTNLGQ